MAPEQAASNVRKLYRIGDPYEYIMHTQCITIMQQYYRTHSEGC